MPHSNTVTYSSDVPHARVNSSLRLIWLVDGGRRQRTQGRSLTPAGVAIAASTSSRIWSRRSKLIGLRRIRSSVSSHSFLFIFLRSRCWRPVRLLFLCRLTYDATITEPTSLETMRYVKDDEQIHLKAVAGVLIHPFLYLRNSAAPRGLLLPFPSLALHNRLRQVKPQQQREIVISRKSVITERCCESAWGLLGR